MGIHRSSTRARFAGSARALAFATLLGSSHEAATASGAPAACTVDSASGTTIDRTPFIPDGYNTRWNFENDLIAFIAPDASGYYRIYTIRPDGSGRRRLAGNPGIPQKHQGLVTWDPSGRYLLFAAQKAEWSSPKLFGAPDYEALPGFGLHDDLWLITADGSHFRRLTDEPNTRREGLLLPVFAPDGSRVAWSERQPDKSYRIKIATFAGPPNPHFTDIRTYRPEDASYYEPGSFSSDGRYLIYTTDQGTHNFWLSQIYRLDLKTGQSSRLTAGVTYNEHPVVFKTPGGDWIVYMSTKDVRRRPFRLTLGTDWYAMRLDGSGAKRLTTMNAPGANNPEDFGEPLVATTATMAPDGTFMLGDVQDSLAKQTGKSLRIHFVCR